MEVEAALEQLGDFGRFQVINYLLLCLPVAHTSIYMLAYVFTARDVPYRCFIPGCDDPQTTVEEVLPPWVEYAAPPSPSASPGRGPRPGPREKCLRYARKAPGCTPEHFDNSTEHCDRWVFPAGENTIASEFKVTCEENKWKLTIIGSLVYIGQMVGTPICGLFSDRFGRRTMLMAIMGMSCLTGMIRSLAPSYGAFAFLAFLDAAFTAGGYTACFILGVELVASRQRVSAGSVLGILSVSGCVYLAVVAWLLRDWRTIIRIVYIPAAASVLSVWLLPESVRWLVSRGRLRDAEAVLAKVVRVNNISVSAPIRLRGLTAVTQDGLRRGLKGGDSDCSVSPGPAPGGRPELEAAVLLTEVPDDHEDFNDSTNHLGDPGRARERERWPVVQVFRSRPLALRFGVIAIVWMANAFVYFGLAIYSVSLAGNVYLNFALSAAVEIPAYLLSWATAEHWGRRASLWGALAFTGASLLVFLVIPQSLITLQLAMYFTGKLTITASFTVLFVLTAELFPTSARHSLLGLCSTVGRLGSVLAAQTPLLRVYYTELPVLLFALVALMGALLTFLLPETLNKSLPDTVRQAEEMETSNKQHKKRDA